MNKVTQGQTITEFVIIMPLFLAFLAGIFEYTYLYRAKTTLNTATFEAVRAGALNHARLAPMETTLANSMMPLYVKGDSSLPGLAKAKLLLEKELVAIRSVAQPVTVVSPTREIFEKLKAERQLRMNYGAKDRHGNFHEQKIKVIPNDNLSFRNTKAVTVNKKRSDGKKIKINVQEANLLKIKTFWCYELKVPALKNIIRSLAEGYWGFASASKEQKACSAIDKVSDTLGLTKNRKSIAIAAHSIIRMQSPIVYDGRNLK